MYDEYDDGDGGGGVGRKVALGLGVVAIAAAGFFGFKAVTGGDGGGAVADGDSTSSSVVVTLSAAGDTVPASSAGERGKDGATTVPETSAGPSTSADLATTTAAAPATTAAPTTATPTTPAPPATYPTRLDGSPEWVTVIYDASSITLKGVVPDEAAKVQLQTLAEQFARPEQRATVNNVVTTNPAMPRGGGVRVVELTSTRFPPGSDEILPEHAAEINRVVAAMTAFPNTTTLIVGHADQQGDEVVNYVLSRDRANAVLFYLASQGIAPERLTATAVGEEELLSLDDDEAALALNRRTEFVLFNLIT